MLFILLLASVLVIVPAALSIDSAAVSAPISSQQALRSAQWIASPQTSDTLPLPIFRHDFVVRQKVAAATLRISGLGQFEARIDGHNVTDTVLNPAWSDYRKRVYYDTYDVTALLKPGENAIGVMLGNGMYNVVATKGRYAKFYGSFGQPKLILQLQIRLADGSEQTIVSDGAWRTAPGPIAYDSIYGGEDYDARLEQPGWDRPGFDASTWSTVAVVKGPGGALMPETIPPIQAFEHFAPARITHPKRGIAVYDLGENFAGWPEITVTGQRGDRVKLIPGELLDANGFVTQASANGTPASQNSFMYVLRGGGAERWHPRFTYYGFRYVQVEETGPTRATIDNLEGRFLHDDVQVDGNFRSSDALLNRIHGLITRAMLSNMVSVLTDCPHREKLGWLEQSHLAAASLMYNYDLSALYAKIADDMQDAQLPDGTVPDIAPEYTVFAKGFRDSPEWGSAVVLSAWAAYQFYGDRRPLAAQFDSMKRYVDYLGRRAHGHLLSYGLGDWLDIGPKPPGESQLTSVGLTATATYYRDLTEMARIAALLDRPADAAAYTQESEEVKAAFNRKFFHPESSEYDSGSQTANALPLVAGLVPAAHRAAVLANLVADIRRHNNHVTAGEVGFHYVVRALTDSGRSDVLYDMLSRTDNPSYGYQLAHHATALTEAWNTDPNLSQNHFALGHAEDWFYRGLAGIDFDMSRDTDSRIRIRPAIVGDIRNVSAMFRSRLGEIESGWSRSGNTVAMDVTIPSGATATILFPPAYRQSVIVNGHALRLNRSIRDIHLENAAPSCIVRAGTYHFIAER